MYVEYNPNPMAKSVGDCTVRAITKATGQTWDSVYTALCLYGFMLCDLPSANAVWGAYLRSIGFNRQALPNTCPDCYTVSDFAAEHKNGTYILALDGHVVCVKNGNIFDSWNSGAETPLYYWEKGN